jgi:hypothetical protein
MLAFPPAHPATLDVVWRMALSGAGFGLFQAPNNRTMIAAAPRERSGGASGMLGTARLLGQTIGAALVALLLARYPVDGTQVALLVGVGFAIWRGAQHAAAVVDRRPRRRSGTCEGRSTRHGRVSARHSVAMECWSIGCWVDGGVGVMASSG